MALADAYMFGTGTGPKLKSLPRPTLFGRVFQRSGRHAFRARLSARPDAKLAIPAVSETSSGLVRRLPTIAARRDTQVYIDTSFLMWMTKIGPAARGELIDWLEALFGGRLNVPVWAAHEYYRHHTERTIVTELTQELDALVTAASRTHAVLWPLLQGGGQQASTERSRLAEVREILRAVPEAAEVGKSWLGSYDANAAEVINFINAHGLANSQVSDYFETLDTVADARFTGRVPPGFKDRGKKSSDRTVVGDGLISVGGNRWGDFVFWREILDDARRRRPRTIVILTRDGKNDWRCAGMPPPGADANDSGPILTPTHPYLTFEAALTSGAKEVLLLDDGRLAAVAESDAPERTRRLVEAARPVALPKPRTTAERRTEETRREEANREHAKTLAADRLGVDFLDPPKLKATQPKLRRAMYESRSDRDAPQTVIALEQRLQVETRTLSEILDEAVAADLDCLGLVIVARRLGQAATSSNTGAAALGDLVDRLPSLPTHVAASLYMGLMTDAYFEEADNQPRTAPRSVVLQQLFALQAEVFAREPIREVRERLEKGDRRPLYMPDIARPKLRVFIRADTERDPRTTLRSIMIEGQDLVQTASRDDLQIRRLVGADEATSESLLEQATRLYGLPNAQLDVQSDVDTAFALDEFQGFRDPREVWLPSTEAQQ